MKTLKILGKIIDIKYMLAKTVTMEDSKYLNISYFEIVRAYFIGLTNEKGRIPFAFLRILFNNLQFILVLQKFVIKFDMVKQ